MKLLLQLNIFFSRVKVDCQDNEGNTASHLVAYGQPKSAPESFYSNELEEIFNCHHLDRLKHIGLHHCQMVKVKYSLK